MSSWLLLSEISRICSHEKYRGLCNITVCSYRLLSSRKKKSEDETAAKIRMFWKLKHYIGVEMQNKLINETVVVFEYEKDPGLSFR